MRLIDADKVNETIDRFIGYLDEDMILRIKMQISKIPTVDRPHGEWIHKTDGLPHLVTIEWFICSECGVQKSESTPFCPSCGARMSALKEGEAE